MRIGGVVSACSDDPQYYQYVPTFVDAWLALFPSIKIRIILVTDTPELERLPHCLVPYMEHIIPMMRDPTLGGAFMSQVVRILYPSLWKTLGDDLAILTTDIDMIPMNTHYYTRPIEKLPANAFVVFRPPSDNQIYICYTAASSSTWSEVNHISSWHDIIRTMHTLPARNWYSDQQLLYRYVMASGLGERIHTLSDVSTRFRRLDRTHGISTSTEDEVKAGAFSDYHMHRPYAAHVALLNSVLSWIQNGRNPTAA
jgi:hypothetical protein